MKARSYATLCKGLNSPAIHERALCIPDSRTVRYAWIVRSRIDNPGKGLPRRGGTTMYGLQGDTSRGYWVIMHNNSNWIHMVKAMVLVEIPLRVAQG